MYTAKYVEQSIFRKNGHAKAERRTKSKKLLQKLSSENFYKRVLTEICHFITLDMSDYSEWVRLRDGHNAQHSLWNTLGHVSKARDNILAVVTSNQAEKGPNASPAMRRPGQQWQ